MTEPTTQEKISEALTEELSPQTVVGEDEDEQDDMPLIYFDWADENAVMFLEPWETRNRLLSELNPSFNRPATVQHLYSLLLKEFARDIEGARVIGKPASNAILVLLMDLWLTGWRRLNCGRG